MTPRNYKLTSTFGEKKFQKIIIYLFFIFFSYSALGAQESVSQTTANSISVEFSGLNILTLNTGVGSFSTQDRATAILNRITELSNDKLFDVSKISTVERDFSTDVTAEDITLVSINEQDAAYAKVPRSQLAKMTAESIKTAIEADRQNKSPKQLLLSSVYALIATIILFLSLLLLSKIFPRLEKYTEKLSKTYIGGIRLHSLELLSADRLNGFLGWLLGVVRLVVTLLLIYLYLPLVLSLFPWTANLAPQIISFATNPVKKMALVAIDYIPNLFFIAVAVLLTRYLLKFIQFFFSEVSKGTLHFDGFYKEWADPTYKLVRFLILVFALIVIFPYLPGAGSPAFQGVSVFVGVLFSLGSSSAISNVVGGIVLTYMRPFKIGDRVKIADTMGDIVEKTLLITRIRTIKNVEITIPNAMVLASHLVNYSSSAESKGLILNTTVTIGYDVPWKTVHNLLKKAAANIPEIKTDPTPFVLQTSLDDFYVSYELNAYTEQPNKMASIYSALHQNIQDEFNAAHVEIMSPHYAALRDGNQITIPIDVKNKT